MIFAKKNNSNRVRNNSNINVINIVHRTDGANNGVLNVALGGAGSYLSNGFNTFLLSDQISQQQYSYVTHVNVTSKVQIKRYLKNHSLLKYNTIIVTHGCWRWPTFVGFYLALSGYSWIYVPHGMLEVWSMGQKSSLKKIYWNLLESKLIKRASLIRAVGLSEESTLKIMLPFQRVVMVSNAIERTSFHRQFQKTGPLRFLFLSRLHHKKGIKELCIAWKHSSLSDNLDFELNIVGPDDGLLDHITELSADCKNLNVLGPLYGDAKVAEFQRNNIFILPSHSEGLPTTALEAMSYALYPMLTSGCNLNDVLDLDLAFEISEVNVTAITKALNDVSCLSKDFILHKGICAQKYVNNEYSFDKINKQLLSLYSQLLLNK